MIARFAPGWLWMVSIVVTLFMLGLRHLPADPPLGMVEDRLVDARFQLRGPRPAPTSVLIVAIDDATLESIGLMTPMREALAEAIPRLDAAGASAVVIDLMLVEPTPADGRLAQALAASPATILAVAEGGGGATSVPPEVRADLLNSAFRVVLSFGRNAPDPIGLFVPAPLLAASVADFGHVNIALSPDRVARRAPLAIPLGEEAMLPSAALVAARHALGLAPEGIILERGRRVRLGHATVPTDSAGRVLINHFGGPKTLETVGLDAILEEQVGAKQVEGRAVFIGATAEGMGDIFATPFAPNIAGVEVLGTLAANLIHGDLMQTGRTVMFWTAWLALGAVVLAGLAALIPTQPLVAAGATVALWLVAAAILQLAFNAGLALDATTVISALLLASAAHWLRRLLADQIGRRALEAERTLLSGYVSPFAATMLPRGGEAPNWRTEAATIGFVDVVGSVGLAEARSPTETAAFLGRIQTCIAGAAERHGGAVVERSGDGALVVFGFGTAGGALDALAFARDVVHSTSAEAKMRVSLQYGTVALADLGGGAWNHIALAGDTVNVAARLQDAAKRAGCAIVVGRAVLESAGWNVTEEAGDLRPLPLETLRGRRQPVEVWAVAP